MILHNSVRRIGLFVGCMLLCTIFTAHTASACECTVVSPSPAPMTCETVESEKTTVDAVIYDIMIAEVKKDTNISPLSSDTRKVLGFVIAPLESKEVTGFSFAMGDIATYFLRSVLEGSDEFAVLSRPRVVSCIDTPAHIEVTDGEAPKYKIELHPIRNNDGGIFTKVVVKRTEISGDKEETTQNEVLVSLLEGNQPNLVMGGKLGDTELFLFVRAAMAVLSVPGNNDPE